MVHPIALVGLLFVKKAVAYGMYTQLRTYGYARAYRRLLEANKVVTPTTHQVGVRGALRAAFRAPAQAAAHLTASEPTRALLAHAWQLSASLGGVAGVLARQAAALKPDALKALLEELGRQAGARK